MSGPDYWQQQQLEEMYSELEHFGLNPIEFVDGQNAARKGYELSSDASLSFVRGYNAEKGLGDINGHKAATKASHN